MLSTQLTGYTTDHSNAILKTRDRRIVCNYHKKIIVLILGLREFEVPVNQAKIFIKNVPTTPSIKEKMRSLLLKHIPQVIFSREISYSDYYYSVIIIHIIQLLRFRESLFPLLIAVKQSYVLDKLLFE